MSEETQGQEDVRCAECGTSLPHEVDRMAIEGGVFCRTCFDGLRAQVQHAVHAQSEDVNYSGALAGGVAGGAVGALVWWGFTIITKVSFGLVAVVIGFAVGKGVVMFSGGKRSRGLQGLSMTVAAVAFGYASYLVNRTMIHRAFAERGESIVLPFLPDPVLFAEVYMAGFQMFDVIFLAIVLWEAWKIPAPFRLP